MIVTYTLSISNGFEVPLEIRITAEQAMPLVAEHIAELRADLAEATASPPAPASVVPKDDNASSRSATATVQASGRKPCAECGSKGPRHKKDCPKSGKLGDHKAPLPRPPEVDESDAPESEQPVGHIIFELIHDTFAETHESLATAKELDLEIGAVNKALKYRKYDLYLQSFAN